MSSIVRALVAIALTACATAPPAPVLRVDNPGSRDLVASNQQFGPPGPTSDAWPWKVSQWVHYQRRYANRIASERLSVVAQDTCGFWIERRLYDNGKHRTWLFCLRAEPSRDDSHLVDTPSIVIERRNREVMYIADGRRGAPAPSSFGWLASLVHAPWPGRTDLPREDVTTPAGRFEQAAKEGSVETTRWSHPAVPLGGIVKEVTRESERVLVEFGTSGRSMALDELADDLELAQRAFREVNESGPWWELQSGFAVLGISSELDEVIDIGSSLGFPVGASLDAVVAATASSGAAYAKDPTLYETLLLFGGGLRWFPLGRTTAGRFGRTRRTRLYGQADVAYANLWRSRTDGDDTTVGRGVAIGARIGVIGAQGRDWSVGLELADHVALLDGDEGLRHTLGVNVFIQLFAEPLSYVLPW